MTRGREGKRVELEKEAVGRERERSRKKGERN